MKDINIKNDSGLLALAVRLVYAGLISLKEHIH